MESSLAIALGSVLLIILLGGISIFKFLSPAQTASLNFNNIKAEAQDVNTQIKLATLNYTLTSLNAPVSSSSGRETSSEKKAIQNYNSLASSSDVGSQINEPSADVSIVSNSLNIESALETLSH
jgi:hypothetical protein